jgi:hypothetical protein
LIVEEKVEGIFSLEKIVLGNQLIVKVYLSMVKITI